MMFALDFLYVALLCWKSFFLFFVEYFYHEGVLNFMECFLCHGWDDPVGFSHFVLLVWYLPRIEFEAEPSLHSRS